MLERKTEAGWVWEWAISSDPDGDSQNVWSAEEFTQKNVEWESGPAFDDRRPHVIPIPETTQPWDVSSLHGSELTGVVHRLRR
ncbi:MAG: hypothetical protein M3O70_22100 [Actinomycetota bacterium]|nr:hypothetical protein [Actinomycetota bacterium]